MQHDPLRANVDLQEYARPLCREMSVSPDEFFAMRSGSPAPAGLDHATPTTIGRYAHARPSAVRPGERVHMEAYRLAALRTATGDSYQESQAVDGVCGAEPGDVDVHLAIDEATDYCLGVVFSAGSACQAASLLLAAVMQDKSVLAAATGASSSWAGACIPGTIQVDKCSHWEASALPAQARALSCSIVRETRRGRFVIERIIPPVDATNLWPKRRAGAPVCPEVRADRMGRFLRTIVRQIVDAHNHGPLPQLGGDSPSKAWDRLKRSYGVRVPPSLADQTRLFGPEVCRLVLRTGIAVAGRRYNSCALQAHRIRNPGIPVLAKLDPSDKTGLLVQIDDVWHWVASVEPTLDKVFPAVERPG